MQFISRSRSTPLFPQDRLTMQFISRSRSNLSFVLVLLLVASAVASDYDHRYQSDEPITLWVNKVGPYNNPQETYNYYSLPFCQPFEKPAHKWGGLGEVLGGNELIDSQIDIKFQRNVEKGTICVLELDAAKVKRFTDAIENSYWFEFFIDDLPLWGYVGETDKSNENKHYLFTHKNILVQYNGNQIIHVNLTQESPKLLEAGKKLDMTYSVKWTPTDVTFAHRFDVYLDYPFFEHQIHWFSIFNSFMMVIFLTGLVAMILMRTLRNDYAKYAREDDDLESLERDVNEESGWKLVHGDVFRTPRNLALLSALVGTGAQLALLILLVILLAIIGMLYIGRGAIVTTFIVCYALTSFISGYVSGGLYSRNGGKSWIKSMILTASLFPFLCFGIGFILNTVAIFYGSLAKNPPPSPQKRGRLKNALHPLHAQKFPPRSQSHPPHDRNLPPLSTITHPLHIYLLIALYPLYLLITGPAFILHCSRSIVDDERIDQKIEQSFSPIISTPQPSLPSSPNRNPLSHPLHFLTPPTLFV